MDKKKIIIVITFIVIILVALLTTLLKTEDSEKTSIIILPLENLEEVNLQLLTQKIINNIPDFSLMDYEFETIIKDTILSNLYIKKPITAIGTIESFKKQISDSLYNFINNNLSQNQSIENKEINRRLELLLKSMISTKNEGKNIYVLVGAFNNCYDSTSAINAIYSIKEIFKNTKETKNVFIWSPYDPNKYVKQVLEELKNQKCINIIDNSVEIKNTRICFNPSDTLFIADIVVLSKFENNEARKVTNKILKELNNKAMIRTISMKGTSNHIAITDSAKLDSIIFNALILSKRNSFIEARTLIIQTLNFWDINSFHVLCKVFLLGQLPMPTESERNKLKLECPEKYSGLLACKTQLERFSNRESPEFILHLKGSPSSWDIQSIFYKVFQNIKIKSKILN